MIFKILNILRNTLFFILLISVISYVIDCVINPSYAIKNIQFLWGYFVYYLIFRAWLVLIVMSCYEFLFKKYTRLIDFLIKLLFVVILSWIYAKLFYMDDYGFSIHIDKQLKLFAVFSISGLILLTSAYLSTIKTLSKNNLS